MQSDPPIYAEPRDLSRTGCTCRWESMGRQGGTMRLAEIGRTCRLHNPAAAGVPLDIYRRESACTCIHVPTGKGWEWQMVEVMPDCPYHQSVRLNPKHVAPWAVRQ